MSISRRKFLADSGKLIATTGLLSGGFQAFADEYPYRASLRQYGPSDTIRLGIIGTGGRGINLMELMRDIPGMEIVACCDILPFRLEEGLALAASGAKGYSDYRKMLEDNSLDAIIVSAPLYLHFEMVKNCLAAGKHIYCEKTMTFTIEEAKKLGELLQTQSTIFQIGYQHRYNPIYKKVNDVIHGDEFGPLSHIECYWNRNGNWRKPVADPQFERIINWRMYKEYSGGLIAELSSHQINIVNWMLDAHPTRIMGMGGIDYWQDGRETFDNTHTLFEYPNGVKASFTCLTTNEEMGFQMKFYGKNASVRIIRAEGYQATVTIEPLYLSQFKTEKKVDGVSSASPKWEAGKPMPLYQTEPGKEDSGPTIEALAAFGACIRENKEPIVGYESGKKSAIAVALANMAISTGEVLQWKDYD
ncbi:MAG: Gfo/Idh/MocA family oxidoreductase [Bacteroidia bacterium]|nr:Gfo/Idh/MocA family oxidoreductase [Bacteroidia bacterium]